MEGLLVLLAFEVTLLAAIAIIRIYQSRTDVLTGPYVFKGDRQLQPPADRQTSLDGTGDGPDSRTGTNDARKGTPQLPVGEREANRSAPIHLDQIHEMEPPGGDGHTALRAVDARLDSTVPPHRAAASGSDQAPRSSATHSSGSAVPGDADTQLYPWSPRPPVPPK
jgi:hypothetical protein